MATLVLTAVGTALGGPLGGALGSLAGRALDTAIIGSPKRESPRLKELAVTTSSYGSPLARHFGTVRAAGSVIWATDLVEHKETGGGGKGKPKITTYSYSISCAIALASRPILDLGRIWADGNLLRGANGSLKVGGSIRIYRGDEDQTPDPLIATDIGVACPAFRGLAYVVFENLQLADFGNRIPALTFEVIADDGVISLKTLLPGRAFGPEGPSFNELSGFSHDGGSDADLVSTLATFYPMACDSMTGTLVLRDASPCPESIVIDLPPPVASREGEFGSRTGARVNRLADAGSEAVSLRYYDTARDYQPGMQRSRAKAGQGKVETIEFPACLTADNARRLADRVAALRECARETMSYRIAVIDPDIRCGSLVRPSGERGIWQVRSWEWRTDGVELELEAISPLFSQGLVAGGDAGQVAPIADEDVGPTILSAFELPWDGTGDPFDRQVFAAASSPGAGWTGAALFVDRGDGALEPAGFANRTRSTVGTALQALLPSTPHLFDRTNSVIVKLVDPLFALVDADIAALAQNANHARIGDELVQFASAVPLGSGQWRLSGLLRGRGGTEAAISEHQPNETFTLIDETLSRLDTPAIGTAAAPVAIAIGNGDPEPVPAPISDPGAFLRPLAPVKGRIDIAADGSRNLHWIRRARGGWHWLDEVDAPLSEASEAYDVRFTDGNGNSLHWQCNRPELSIDAGLWAELLASPTPRTLQVRQIGSASLSRPLAFPI